MRTVRLSLILGSILILLIGILLSSVRSNKQNYILEGVVHCEEKSPVSLDVYVTQSRKFPETFEGLHRARTMEGGHFKTEFHAEVGAPIYFYVIKHGTLPVRHVFYPKSRDGLSQRLTSPIVYTPIFDESGLYQYAASNKGEVPIFGSNCSNEPIESVSIQDIQYVEDIQHIYCDQLNTVALRGDIYTKASSFLKSFFTAVTPKQVYNKD